MSYKEDFINMMRNQGSYHNAPGPQLGEMKTDKICMVGDMQLDEDDYSILASAKGTLQAGDDVLVIPISGDDNDTEDYIVLGKVEKP